MDAVISWVKYDKTDSHPQPQLACWLTELRADRPQASASCPQAARPADGWLDRPELGAAVA
jgi:hypothetical protein